MWNALTQQTFCLSPDVPARDSKTPVMTWQAASDWGWLMSWAESVVVVVVVDVIAVRGFGHSRLHPFQGHLVQAPNWVACGWCRFDELNRVVCELSRAVLLFCVALAPSSLRYVPGTSCAGAKLSSLGMMPIDELCSVVCVDVVRSLGHSTLQSPPVSGTSVPAPSWRGTTTTKWAAFRTRCSTATVALLCAGGDCFRCHSRPRSHPCVSNQRQSCVSMANSVRFGGTCAVRTHLWDQL